VTPKLSSAVVRVNSSEGIGGGSEEKSMTASVFVERLRRAGVDQRREPPVPRVKVSIRAPRFISGLAGASAVTTT
jgi:hypothetical protein